MDIIKVSANSRTSAVAGAIAGVIRKEYDRHGVEPVYPIDVLATISSALFEGLGVTRLINPALVGRDTVNAVLGFLWNTIGRDAGADAAAPGDS